MSTALSRIRPYDWTPEQRAEWIAAWNNDKPGLLPIPFHPAAECGFCEIFHRLIEEAAKVREARAS